MKTILTITANPSIDTCLSIAKVVSDNKNLCKTLSVEPGGGGINISRVIKKLGGISQTWFFAGGHNGERLTELVIKKDIAYKRFPIKNETRESLIVFENSTSEQYLLNVEGPKIHEGEWLKLLEALDASEPFDYIIASGSLPRSAPVRFFASLAKIAKEKGSKIILDTSGKALQAAMVEGVYMIKPNLAEFCYITGLKNPTIDAMIEKAEEMVNYLCCEVVLISLGKNGAIVVTNDFSEHISAPTTVKKNSVGAGDSLVAGMVLSLSKGMELRDAVRYGIACGAAATLSPAANLCEKDDVDSLYATMTKPQLARRQTI